MVKRRRKSFSEAPGKNKAKRANKKKKKKVEPKQQKTVAAVQVKSYSAQGKEFETVGNPNGNPNSSGNDNLPSQQEDQNENEDEEAGSLATFNITQQHSIKPYQQQQQQQYQVPPPPPFDGNNHNSPPIPSFNTPAAPPLAPAFNSPPPPIAPPLISAYDTPSASAPMAPAIDTPFPPPIASGGFSSSTSSRGFLGQIQSGVQLRKAEPVTNKPSDVRGGLLGEIRNRNFQLKRVDKEEEKAKAEAADKGGLSSIMAVLARRQAIASESDDEEEGEGGDWD